MNCDCRQITDFLMLFLENELPEAERRAFQEHLAVCPPCVRYLDSYKRTIDLTRLAATDLSETGLSATGHSCPPAPAAGAGTRPSTPTLADAPASTGHNTRAVAQPIPEELIQAVLAARKAEPNS